MKDRTKKHNRKLNSNLNAKTDVTKVDRENDLQLIFERLDSKIEDKFADRALDFEKEKIQLLGGTETSEAEIKQRRIYLLNNVAVYEKMFPQEFYDEIFRLNNWKLNSNKSLRPSIVGTYTNFCIYLRFDRKILPQLQTINPYVEFGIRKFKHFQWLNYEGRQKLLLFIQQSIEVMKKCETWQQFVEKYGKLYNIPTQVRIELN
ncbi:P63C domain-containing protein [Sphingobacterium corticibacter]|uniref:Bacteriophage Mx8 p63 C-terminal domain-containing protein n=1 Tax=Sphingobacterium corticibacter TaxID=2171749 RepID=A0A2T8HLJ0_9SPHI|nr:P63C domain-containing protein [Sphingobacterium corticibacter]PVH26273.1 hypothetical protein DC487_01210 [Sphingobacterium corticibacter]